jgi:hypothetical protein
MLESSISARAASTSSQDWKRAASENSAGTPSSSIRREVGSSSRDGQPRHIKIVHAGGVAAGLFVVRHPGQDLPRLGKRRLAVRIVRALHHVVDADDVSQSNADGVLSWKLSTILRRKKSLGSMRP